MERLQKSGWISEALANRSDSMTHLRTDIDRARRIYRTLGIRPAAGFMRNRGWSIESALYVLLGIASRG